MQLWLVIEPGLGPVSKGLGKSKIGNRGLLVPVDQNVSRFELHREVELAIGLAPASVVPVSSPESIKLYRRSSGRQLCISNKAG